MKRFLAFIILAPLLIGAGPIIWNGANGKLISSGTIINSNGTPFLISQEINYIGSPDTHIGWVDGGTGITASTTSTGSELPRQGFDAQALKLVNDGSGTDGQSFCLQVGEVDKNRRLRIKWAQRTDGTNYNTGDFTYRLTSNTASDCSGTETPVKLRNSDSSSAQDLKAINYEMSDSFDAKGADYYQLYIERASGSASSWVALSNIVVGPGELADGTEISEWENFTPTFNNLSQSVAQSNGRYRQVGESMEVEAMFRQNTGAAGSDATNITMTIPDNKTINSGTGGIASTSMSGLGFWRLVNGTTLADGVNNVINYDSATTVKFRSGGGTGSFFQDDDLGSGNYFVANFEVPIAEWRGKGTTTMLTDSVIYANARVRARLTSNQSIATGTNTRLIFDTEDYDNTNSYDPSTGFFSCPVDGTYRVTAQAKWGGSTSAAGQTILYISVTGTNVSRNQFQPSTFNFTMSATTDVECAVGQNIFIQVFQDTGGSVDIDGDTSNRFTVLNIERLSDFTHGDGVGLGEASATERGLVGTGPQPFGGVKTFIDGVVINDTAGQSTLNFYKTETVALNGDLTGNIRCERIGRTVTITANGAVTHSAAAGPSSSSGVIPSEYRPTAEVRNMFILGGGFMASVTISTTGTFSLVYRDYSGALDSSRTSTDRAPSITYTIY